MALQAVIHMAQHAVLAKGLEKKVVYLPTGKSTGAMVKRWARDTALRCRILAAAAAVDPDLAAALAGEPRVLSTVVHPSYWVVAEKLWPRPWGLLRATFRELVALTQPPAAAAAPLPDFGNMRGLSVDAFFAKREKKSKPVPRAISECAD